jgi:hypothetical protein
VKSRLREALFEQAHNPFLHAYLVFQQRGTSVSHREVKQASADVAAHVPGDRRDVQPRGLGQVLRFGDAATAFAGRFHRDIDVEKRNPGRHPARGAEVVARSQIERWIRTRAGSSHTGLSGAPLRPRHIETRVEVKGSEGQCFEIPGFRRPGFQVTAKVSFEEFFQAGVVEPARVELRRVVGGRNRLRLEPGAAGQPRREEDDRAAVHGTDGMLVGIFTAVWSMSIRRSCLLQGLCA